ncbi:small nuclear RNA activating complex polypeptide 1 L homeolog isoform X2 [Xenopus laevis]|uniref:Small nuclear RNA activating complex polypeptide 1 L homeolog isoform X2 n=1 Tax=Xenopus laevis TaxID=8355 RepID=A0A8J1LGX1_XENLA|nr:small nuclear RNA activating complex polypeptide 1 L homeolog isoform X2 [Xenopus laevis]
MEGYEVFSHIFIRVGALYLLYGLYNSQLCQPKQKIRIALKDWNDIDKFYQDLIGAQHLDAAYIMRQLRISRAFHFTGMPEFLTFRYHRNQPRHVGKDEFKDARDRVQDLVTSETLEEMLNIHEHYQKTKCLISADKSQPDRSLSLVKEDFVPNLKHLLSEHESWKLEKGKPRTKIDDENEEKEGASQESESSERAQTLAKIKSKCYGAVTEAPKSRRHRQVKMASSDSSSDCVGKKSQKSKRKRRAPRKTEILKGSKLGKSKKNMPTIPEEDSTSSSSGETYVPKRTRKR